jgi:hypothetical protein
VPLGHKLVLLDCPLAIEHWSQEAPLARPPFRVDALCVPAYAPVQARSPESLHWCYEWLPAGKLHDSARTTPCGVYSCRRHNTSIELIIVVVTKGWPEAYLGYMVISPVDDLRALHNHAWFTVSPRLQNLRRHRVRAGEPRAKLVSACFLRFERADCPPPAPCC